MQQKKFETTIAGKVMTAIFSDLAERAHGSVIVKLGDTAVLATAVMAKEERDGDFFPLTVDYEERFYAGGKILGSQFVRREGRPSDAAILSGRIVDRTVRPLFDNRIRNEVQVVLTVLAFGDEDVNVVSVVAASLALSTSDIPWKGPVGAVRIGMKEKGGTFVINPGYVERAKGLALDLLVCGKDGLVNMIETASNELSEKILVDGLEKAVEVIETIEKFQKQIIAEIGKKKRQVELKEVPAEVKSLFESFITPRISKEIFGGIGGEKIDNLKNEWVKEVKAKLKEDMVSFAESHFEEEVNALIHDEAIDNGKRADGRGIDEVRPLFATVGGISPVLHGSAIFYRGGTHILSVTTLGGPKDSLIIEGMEGSENKRYMHHYNFPPYSTGETGRMGGTNRRMIGHGALAEKALIPVLPPKEKFPYTIRVVSEALSSNGSTSMGSVCGSTLSLMDAGVPISRPVAGIASGLMMRESKKLLGGKKYEYKVLTDIQGPEDHHGDMDFKVAGTTEGITAVQMDVKVGGIPVFILSEAFEKARIARLHILSVMSKAIEKPRADISANAPKIVVAKIRPDQIGLVIGGGGKTVNEIREKTGTEIDIDDDGTIYITGKNGGAEKAKAVIEEMTREYKAGDKFDGEVTKVLDFGAFVRISGKTEGLVHVSEIASFRVEKINDVIKVGDKVPVVIKEIDDLGRLSLSIKRIAPDFIKQKVA